MMKVLIYLFTGLFLITLTQCNTEGSEDSQITSEGKEAPYEIPEGDLLDQISWIEGNWALHNGVNYEKWERHKDGYSILGYKMNMKDTLVVERGVFKKEGDSYYLTISVGHIRKGAPMRYKMTSTDPTMLVFQNSEYDFPTKLKYIRKSSKTIQTHVEGTIGNEFKSYPGMMKKR